MESSRVPPNWISNHHHKARASSEKARGKSILLTMSRSPPNTQEYRHIGGAARAEVQTRGAISKSKTSRESGPWKPAPLLHLPGVWRTSMPSPASESFANEMQSSMQWDSAGPEDES